MSTTTWTITAAELARITFGVAPRDAGQIVAVSYGLWADGCGGGLCIRCTHDQSDGTTTYEAAELGDDDEVDVQNGEPAVSAEYLPLTVTRRK